MLRMFLFEESVVILHAFHKVNLQHRNMFTQRFAKNQFTRCLYTTYRDTLTLTVCDLATPNYKFYRVFCTFLTNGRENGKELSIRI